MAWLSNFIRRMSDQCADAHGLDHAELWGRIWAGAGEWDREHANSDELWRECDRDALRQAHELYEAGDRAGAFQNWLDLAEQGSVWSMIEVGRCYEYGRGVPADPTMAENWYRRALAGGSQIAMLKCAKFAAQRGDYTAAREILQAGVDQDWVPAIFWFAWYCHKQSATGETYRAILPMLKDAARRGHPAARVILANFMVRGKFGRWRIPIGIRLVIRLGSLENAIFSAEKA